MKRNPRQVSDSNKKGTAPIIVGAIPEWRIEIYFDFIVVEHDFTDEKITFSCGIAPYKKNLQRQEFFDMADSGLYVAKETGKNRIITVLETNTKDASQM